MSQNQQLEEALSRHPCYNRDAHREFARMHVPVAPRCNIQCNYCNRKYDCCNESRPGVTSEVLTPEQAAEKVAYVKSKIPNLSVVGIAGPGDPLANEETFRTLGLVSEETPDLTLCVSTNGLALPDSAQRLYDLGVRFITVTMNACDPDVGAEIYGSVRWDGRVLKGREGAELLIARQTEGIEKCAALGMLVKVNIVMVPGINDGHIPDLVKYVKGKGAYIVNILPLIPVEGTPFADLRAPTPEERREMMDRCSLDARMMRHCRQCRADAIGLLDQDRSQEFVNFGGCGSGCGPQGQAAAPNVLFRDPNMVAVATSDGVSVRHRRPRVGKRPPRTHRFRGCLPGGVLHGRRHRDRAHALEATGRDGRVRRRDGRPGRRGARIPGPPRPRIQVLMSEDHIPSMRVSWVIAALLVLALVASPVLASDDSEAADGQPKQVVFIDRGEVHAVMYYTDGFHAPDDPRHHGLRLVGWAYGDDVVDVDTFDFDTVPENPVYLYAVYEEDPVGGAVSDIAYYGAIAFILFCAFLVLLCLRGTFRRSG